MTEKNSKEQKNNIGLIMTDTLGSRNVASKPGLVFLSRYNDMSVSPSSYYYKFGCITGISDSCSKENQTAMGNAIFCISTTNCEIIRREFETHLSSRYPASSLRLCFKPSGETSLEIRGDARHLCDTLMTTVKKYGDVRDVPGMSAYMHWFTSLHRRLPGTAAEQDVPTLNDMQARVKNIEVDIKGLLENIKAQPASLTAAAAVDCTAPAGKLSADDGDKNGSKNNTKPTNVVQQPFIPACHSSRKRKADFDQSSGNKDVEQQPEKKEKFETKYPEPAPKKTTPQNDTVLVSTSDSTSSLSTSEKINLEAKAAIDLTVSRIEEKKRSHPMAGFTGVTGIPQDNSIAIQELSDYFKMAHPFDTDAKVHRNTIWESWKTIRGCKERGYFSEMRFTQKLNGVPDHPENMLEVLSKLNQIWGFLGYSWVQDKNNSGYYVVEAIVTKAIVVEIQTTSSSLSSSSSSMSTTCSSSSSSSSSVPVSPLDVPLPKSQKKLGKAVEKKKNVIDMTKGGYDDSSDDEETDSEWTLSSDDDDDDEENENEDKKKNRKHVQKKDNKTSLCSSVKPKPKKCGISKSTKSEEKTKTGCDSRPWQREGSIDLDAYERKKRSLQS